jgi:anti-sigma regulatory factor (Ser/Thr protein kinase)
LKELALHVLDIVNNSVSANAKNITIEITENTTEDRLTIEISDDGSGMDADTVSRITDPFVTSRTTRRVGLGIPLLKAAAEACNGGFSIQSKLGVGTRVKVDFQLSHIDRMPMGDLAGTMLGLVTGCPEIHWKLDYRVDENEFHFDDEPLKRELGMESLSEPLVISYLRGLLKDGIENLYKQ